MILYKTLRSILSHRARGWLTRLLYITGLKPRVNRSVKSPLKTGVVVLSADFEMAWAFRFSRTRRDRAVEAGLFERKNVPALLELLDRYSIPVTWATVGHLFLSECKRDEFGSAHSAMPRPPFFSNRNWSYDSGDWYKHDPCTDFIRDPAWYASDLVDLISEARAGHEFGCHTFSHADFTYSHCSEEMAEAELNATIAAAAVKGISMRSMVFPGGTFGNYESLVKKGFTCYRKPMKYHIDMCHLDKHGLVSIPSSIGLGRDQYGWDAKFHLRILDSFLAAAARRRLVCHFWFHPSLDQWYLENVMPSLLAKIDAYRKRGEVSVMTMGELADEYLRFKG